MSSIGDLPAAPKRAFIRFIAEHDRFMDVEASSAALADIGATTEAQNRAYTKLADALRKREGLLPGSPNIPPYCQSRVEADRAVWELDIAIDGYLTVLVPDALAVAS